MTQRKRSMICTFVIEAASPREKELRRVIKSGLVGTGGSMSMEAAPNALIAQIELFQEGALKLSLLAHPVLHSPNPHQLVMNIDVIAPRMQWGEISSGFVAASQELLGKLTIRSVLSHSWEAGGVYPTLLGYLLGAVATLAVFGASRWFLRFPPAMVCAIVFAQTLLMMESSAFVFLLVFAGVVGILCTYVQVVSWQEAFANVALRRRINKKVSKTYKVDKAD